MAVDVFRNNYVTAQVSIVFATPDRHAVGADLGHGDPGTAYTALLAADAAGALTAGILLESSSMTQTLVQMNAPDASRGRVLGLYHMAGSGLRSFSGITVGVAGSAISIHGSLAVAAACFVLGMGSLVLGLRSSMRP